MLFLNSIRAHVKGLESWRPAEVPCPLLGLNAKRGRRAWDTCGHAPSSGGLGTEGGPATRHNTGGPEGVTLTETSLSQQDAQDGSTYTGPGGQVHRQPAGGWVPGTGSGWGSALQGDEFGGWPWQWLHNGGDVLDATEPRASNGYGGRVRVFYHNRKSVFFDLEWLEVLPRAGLASVSPTVSMQQCPEDKRSPRATARSTWTAHVTSMWERSSGVAPARRASGRSVAGRGEVSGASSLRPWPFPLFPKSSGGARKCLCGRGVRSSWDAGTSIT